jgi:hypothetical protein
MTRFDDDRIHLGEQESGSGCRRHGEDAGLMISLAGRHASDPRVHWHGSISVP